MNTHSALRQAIEKGNLQAVIAALDHGAEIEESDIHGDTGLPLRIACFKGHADIALELIKRGADVHAPNAQGSGGPARMAARGQHAHIIELLLAHGAEPPAETRMPQQASSDERRKRGDRRRRDIGPPASFRERRQLRERRAMLVREVALSDGQWERYFAQTQPNQPFPEIHPDFIDTASTILERVRD